MLIPSFVSQNTTTDRICVLIKLLIFFDILDVLVPAINDINMPKTKTVFTCSKSTMKSPGKSIKSVQSWQ